MKDLSNNARYRHDLSNKLQTDEISIVITVDYNKNHDADGFDNIVESFIRFITSASKY